MELSRTLCVHHLFEEQVRLQPDRIALIADDTQLTYRELNNQANQLATWLKARYAIAPNQLIGIKMSRVPILVVSILAVLKTGAAYLPLEEKNPHDLNAFICTDSSILFLLTDGPISENERIACIDTLPVSVDIFSDQPAENLNCAVSPADLMVAMFTSGSTGKPKGVIMSHQCLSNFLSVNINRFRFEQDERFLQSSAICFDLSMYELFTPLVTGGCVVLLKPGAQGYPEEIANAIEKYGVTMVSQTPALLQQFVNYLEFNQDKLKQMRSVKRIIVGGEKLTPNLVNRFNKLLFKHIGTGLTNIYGPTEATIWVTAFDCESEHEFAMIPIGCHVGNNGVHITDEYGNLLADGEIGEILISGPQVALGYLNRPVLNAAKFISHPTKPGELMYKTGDHARMMPDGNIEFLGRMDDLVKLNGLRIELGDVENAILAHENIKECCVLMKQVNGNNQLVAYFTVNNDDNAEIVHEIVEGLKLNRPDYMIPLFYVKLKEFPLTTNGKIKKDMLEAPGYRYYNAPSVFVPPTTQHERVISAILTELLALEEIGIDDSVFELGMQSLLVTQAIQKINSALNCKISLQNFFQMPTVRELAILAAAGNSETLNPFVMLKPGEGTPLFILPGAHGNPVDFLAFSQTINIDKPIFSLSYPDDDDFNSHQNLCNYAAYLIEHMKAIQPVGPYYLMGFSFGGVVLFEMAVQLQENGDTLASPVLISSSAPYKKGKVKRYGFLRHELNLFGGANYFLQKKYLRYRLPFLVNKLINKVSAKSTGTIGVNTKLAMKSNTAKMFNDYTQSQKFKGDMMLIYEDWLFEQGLGYELEDIYEIYSLKEQWAKNLTGHLSAHKLNLGHYHFFKEPAINTVANLVANYFNANTITTVPYAHQDEAPALFG